MTYRLLTPYLVVVVVVIVVVIAEATHLRGGEGHFLCWDQGKSWE